MSPINTSVFEYVDERALALATDGREALQKPDTSLTLFAREFFKQFIADVFEIKVVSFSNSVATEVQNKIKLRRASATKKAKAQRSKKARAAYPHDRPTTKIVAAFREFCLDYETILEEEYDDEDDSDEKTEPNEFEGTFIPDLLLLIADWSEKHGRSALLRASVASHAKLALALETVRE